MDAKSEERTPITRRSASAPEPGPLLDEEARRRVVDGLRTRLGSWCSALDLAERAGIRIEPTVGVPGGVVVCQRVVFFEAGCGITEGQRLVGLGVAAALLADFFVTFTIADIEPLAAALFAVAAPQ